MAKISARFTSFVVFATMISFVISLAGSSIKSTVQVLFLPIADSFEVNRGTLAIATTVFAVTTALASFMVGHLVDRIGVVRVLAIGTATTGGVLLLCASANTVWIFIVGYGLLGGISYTMLSYVPLGVLAGQLLQGRHAGVVYAILTNGGAVGLTVLVPLWVYLSGSLSWNQILVGVGLVFLVVLLPLSLVLQKHSARSGVQARSGTKIMLREAFFATFQNRRVLPLFIAFFACGVTMAFIDVHLFPHMHDHGVSASVGSLAVAVLGILEIIGALVAGRLCDLGRIRSTLMYGYLLRGGSMMLLPFVSSKVMIILFGATFGASYLATVIATTVWINRIMPVGTRGTALGLLWAVHMIAVAISGQVGAMLADALHSYLAIIVISIILLLVAAILVGVQPDPDATPPQLAGRETGIACSTPKVPTTPVAPHQLQ